MGMKGEGYCADHQHQKHQAAEGVGGGTWEALPVNKRWPS